MKHPNPCCELCGMVEILERWSKSPDKHSITPLGAVCSNPLCKCHEVANNYYKSYLNKISWNQELKDKIVSLIILRKSGCWGWKMKKNLAGYSVITIEKKQYKAHRVVYEMLKGKIPEGLVIDHLCRKPGCVNPDHMEPVSSTENVMRGKSFATKNLNKKRCKRGHLLQGATLGVRKSRRSDNQERWCRKCTSITGKIYYETKVKNHG